MEKQKFEDIKLSEEITKNGKIMKDCFKYVPKPHMLFLAKIPYNGFIISLAHLEVTKELSEFYYKRSKYGWWTFCATKDELDETDKKMIGQINNNDIAKYGFYKELGHNFCFDNQHEKNEEIEKEFGIKPFYDLHPNDMVKIIKRQIDKFYKDKEKLKNEK